MAVILNVGDEFDIGFKYNNIGPNKAFNVRAQIVVDPSLQLLTVEGKNASNIVVGGIGSSVAEYIIGDGDVGYIVNFVVRVKILAVSNKLNVTFSATRDGVENVTENDFSIKNIITVFDGVFGPSYDGTPSVIIRVDSIRNIEPTIGEVPVPIEGNSANVFLTDDTLEKWVYTSGAWVLRYTQESSIVDSPPMGPYDSFSDAAADVLLLSGNRFFLSKGNDELIPVSGDARGQFFRKL